MLAADIDESAQTIVVNDGTVLSDAPNIASIGAGPVAETILYGAKEGNV
jgi:type III secretion system FlhB-like substrate exporter